MIIYKIYIGSKIILTNPILKLILILVFDHIKSGDSIAICLVLNNAFNNW